MKVWMKHPIYHRSDDLTRESHDLLMISTSVRHSQSAFGAEGYQVQTVLTHSTSGGVGYNPLQRMLIKLAYANPELRDALLPMLSQ